MSGHVPFAPVALGRLSLFGSGHLFPALVHLSRDLRVVNFSCHQSWFGPTVFVRMRESGTLKVRVHTTQNRFSRRGFA